MLITPLAFGGFQDAIVDENLVGIPLQGYPYTWWRSKGTVDEVEEKLDRALARQD